MKRQPPRQGSPGQQPGPGPKPSPVPGPRRLRRCGPRTGAGSPSSCTDHLRGAGLGDLLVTVGADDTAYAKALPVLEAMASTLKRVSPRPGDGQCMKTVNQLLCGVHIAAAAEALALARALGLDPAAALETLGAGAAASFMLGDRG